MFRKIDSGGTVWDSSASWETPIFDELHFDFKVKHSHTVWNLCKPPTFRQIELQARSEEILRRWVASSSLEK